MDCKKEIIDILKQISGRYSMYEVFHDWIKCCSIAIQNAYTQMTGLWESREKEYLDTMKKYEKEEGLLFSEMLLLLEIELKKRPRDILGEIFMESEMGSKATGQFFTPYKISELLARLATRDISGGKKHLLYEPTCGSGGGIIAEAELLREKGIDIQGNVEVVAQDLDWKSVYMCYLQLSLLGIPAICIQGDTLEKEYKKEYKPENVLYTPAKVEKMIKKRKQQVCLGSLEDSIQDGIDKELPFS